MSPEPWPQDAVARRAWIAAIVGDIRHRCPSGRHALLMDLLRAAWPSRSAQDH